MLGGAPSDVVVGEVEGGLRQWMEVFRVTQVGWCMYDVSRAITCISRQSVDMLLGVHGKHFLHQLALNPSTTQSINQYIVCTLHAH